MEAWQHNIFFLPTAYVRRASFCGPHIPHIPVTAQNNCPYLGCDTHLPANLLSFFTYFPPIRMRWKWWKTRNLSVVSLTWLVMDSVKLDSALSLTVFSLTRCCLGQCLAWFSTVHDSVQLDSELSSVHDSVHLDSGLLLHGQSLLILQCCRLKIKIIQMEH